MQVTTIGLDLAKQVFQVHGVDAEGVAVLRRRLRRSEVVTFFSTLPGCLIGIEACATAHHWGRELSRLGHQVKLIPPSYVKAYVKRGKTDAADAEAICEAVSRPSMRFVPLKSTEQQSALMLHRSRDLLVRQRTMLVNAVRGHFAEFGIIAPQGIRRIGELAALLIEEDAKYWRRCRPWRSRSPPWRRPSLPAIGTTRRAAGWRRSLVLDRLPLRRLLPLSLMHISSNRQGTSRRGSA